MTGGQCGRLSHTSLAPLLFVLLMALPAFAQSPTVSVSGAVVDADTRAPIAGVVVSLDGRQTVSDPNGVFVVTLSPGSRSPANRRRAGSVDTETADHRFTLQILSRFRLS